MGEERGEAGGGGVIQGEIGGGGVKCEEGGGTDGGMGGWLAARAA